MAYLLNEIETSHATMGYEGLLWVTCLSSCGCASSSAIKSRQADVHGAGVSLGPGSGQV